MKVMSCRTSSLGLGQGELDHDLDKYSEKNKHYDHCEDLDHHDNLDHHDDLHNLYYHGNLEYLYLSSWTSQYVCFD